MTYFQRNTFLFTAWCQVLFNVLLHYVTAESYLHYNKGIFYKIVSGLLHAAFGPRYNVLIIDHVLKSGPSISHTIRPPTHVFPMLIKARKMSQRPNELILWMSGFCFNKKWNIMIFCMHWPYCLAYSSARLNACIYLNIREFHQDADSLRHPPNSLIFKSVSNF